MTQGDKKLKALHALKWVINTALFFLSGSFAWAIVSPDSFFGALIFIGAWIALFVFLFKLLSRYRKKYYIDFDLNNFKK
jgi:hypothetical protein